MRTWRLAIAGFGTVGRGAAERLAAAQGELRAYGCDARIVGVLDPQVGSVLRPEGLDPERLLAMAAAGESLSVYPGGEPVDGLDAAIDRAEIDVLFEATPTDLKTGGVGLEHVRQALTAGIHVATTNKGPIVLDYPALSQLAAEHGVQLRCEGTVMSGTPLLNVCEGGLAGAGVTGVRGILNGTCNFMLSRMEDGADYDAALREAQELGYAETDPAGDVEGWDAAAKVAILGNLVLGASLTLADVAREGIAGVSRGDIDRARDAGRRLRLVGAVGMRDGVVVDPRVGVEELELDDPLAAVRGAGNLLTIDTDALGAVSIAGPGAGKAATGHALVADLVAIHRTATP